MHTLLKLLLTVLCILSTHWSYALEDHGFEPTLAQTLQAFNGQDLERFTPLIHPQVGLYVLSTSGAYFSHEHFENAQKFFTWYKDLNTNTRLCTGDKDHCNAANMQIEQGMPARFSAFCLDENEASPTKTQNNAIIYVENANQAGELVDYFETEKRSIDDHLNGENAPTPTLLAQIRQIQNHSKWVSLNTAPSFYLTQIQGQWYLTVIDLTPACEP